MSLVGRERKTTSKRIFQKRTGIVKDVEDLNGLEVANLKN